MDTLLIVLPAIFFTLLFILLLIGLFNPNKILFWSKRATRMKVFGYWILSNIIIIIVMVMISNHYDSKRSPEERLKAAKEYFNKQEYSSAVYQLKKIPTESNCYKDAQCLLIKADSLYSLQLEEHAKLEAKQKDIDTTMLEIVSVRIAKKSIKQRLKAPSTAKFSKGTFRIWFLPDSSVVIKGEVDAQNSFGAMLRSHFFFKAKWYSDFQDDRNWEILKVNLE